MYIENVLDIIGNTPVISLKKLTGAMFCKNRVSESRWKYKRQNSKVYDRGS